MSSATPQPRQPDGQLPRELPLVGRESELEHLLRIFGGAEQAAPLQVISGESGVGKSRLAMVVAAEAERRGWTVLRGRAYPVDQGAPYALVADAFMPLLQAMEPQKLTVLSRGREADLYQLFPALGLGRPDAYDGMDPEELRTRLFWTFRGVLKALSAQTPIFIVLEDLHWADPSSLALLHFVARQLDEQDVRVVGTWTAGQGADAARVTDLAQTLRSQGLMDQLELGPLGPTETQELIERVFGMSGHPVADFAHRLYGWTRGNAYFLEQVLQSLVQSGGLHEHEGTWLGWESGQMTLPNTVRDAVLARLLDVPPLAQDVADTLAILGRPAPLRLVQRVLARDMSELGAAVDALVGCGLVEESEQDGEVVLRFFHPLSRETLYRQLSLTRRGLLHDAVAGALEGHYGSQADAHADEVAYHLIHDGRAEHDPRAVRYLEVAGTQALARHAYEEAVSFLSAAAQVLSETEDVGASAEIESQADRLRVSRLLAQACARSGNYERAEQILKHLRRAAEVGGTAVDQARGLRQLGLLAYWQGRNEDALERLDAGLEILPADEGRLRVQMQLAAGMAFQQLGRPADSRQRIEDALRAAAEMRDTGLLARSHRALALILTWIGETDEARRNAHLAVELGEEAGDQNAVFWGHWALASLEGLVGGPGPMKPWLDRARQSAGAVGSPVLQLFVDELELEYLYFTGDWDQALALGARAVQLGRSLSQRALLVRVLTSTASVYLGRGEFERAHELITEAEELAGVAGVASSGARDVHAAVPALIGRTQYYLAQDMGDEALEVGAGALIIAGVSGYIIWVLHRLLPMMAEAFVRVRDLDGASEVRDRLLREGAQMDHRLSQLWARASDALITWWSGDMDAAVEQLRDAADAMEEMGIVYDSARIRRQYAGRLAELERRDEALSELRRVHRIFEDLGAEPERRRARSMFSELEARRPSTSRTAAAGHTLSSREWEIARLVADRASNKEIARTLDIAVRTVTTHLTNVYKRLDLSGSAAGKRAALGDMVREGRLSGSAE